MMLKKTWNYTDSYDYMEQIKEGLPPAIICCACNGGVQGKEYNPNIPETPEEIATAVYDSYQAGASMVHVHARDAHDQTKPATSAKTWFRVNQLIRERCPDIIINNSTGGGFGITMEERIACLDGNPEIASLNLLPDMSKFHLKERKAPLPNPRDAISYDDTFAFTYKQINHFAKEMKKRKIKPELEIYHPGGAWVVRDLIDNGLLEKPYWIQTVMGYQTSSFPTVDNVIQILKDFPKDSLWLCSGIGPFQLPMTTLSTLMGGHVRIGLEDNIYFSKGEKAQSNAQLTKRAVRIIQELNRTVATPQQARNILGISNTPTKY